MIQSLSENVMVPIAGMIISAILCYELITTVSYTHLRMRNSRLLPYETIVQAASGEPEAVNTILQHYRCLLYTSRCV